SVTEAIEPDRIRREKSRNGIHGDPLAPLMPAPARIHDGALQSPDGSDARFVALGSLPPWSAAEDFTQRGETGVVARRHPIAGGDAAKVNRWRASAFLSVECDQQRLNALALRCRSFERCDRYFKLAPAAVLQRP